MLEVNVKGSWLCAKAAIPPLRGAGGGSIVNMASEVAFSARRASRTPVSRGPAHPNRVMTRHRRQATVVREVS